MILEIRDDCYAMPFSKFRAANENWRRITSQEDLRQIRSELSKDLERMNSAQRNEYLKAAKEIHDGHSKMIRIRSAIRS